MKGGKPNLFQALVLKNTSFAILYEQNRPRSEAGLRLWREREFVTGGAAKSIQSINAAAAVAVVVAAAVAGLASPDATHKYEKTVCVAQNSPFSLSFNFFGATISFFPCPCPP